MEFARFKLAPPVEDGGGVGGTDLAFATAAAAVTAPAVTTAVATGVATGEAVPAAGRTGAEETLAAGAEGIDGADGTGGGAI